MKKNVDILSLFKEFVREVDDLLSDESSTFVDTVKVEGSAWCRGCSEFVHLEDECYIETDIPVLTKLNLLLDNTKTIIDLIELGKIGVIDE